MEKEIEKIIESLNTNEKKVLDNIKEERIENIVKKTNLDKTSVLRALEYLENKKIVILEHLKIKIVDLGINGLIYKKKGLPERRLSEKILEKKILNLNEINKELDLSEEEIKASIGALKNKALIEIKNGKLILNANGEEIIKKTLEEKFLEELPLNLSDLTPEQKYALKILEKRKNIITIKEEDNIKIKLTKLGEEVEKEKSNFKELIENITPNLLGKESNWRGKKFRRYDVTSKLPEIYGGKSHFVNQAIEYAKKVWIDLGFKEMEGNIIESSFWVFDALFTPQDHPAREMQDTFFIRGKTGELPEKRIVEAVKKSHEQGIEGSKGWNYQWKEDESKKLVLRTHTTAVSSYMLSKIKKEDIPCKYFALGKCFRNETADWSHGFEFNQTEGIVIAEGLTFRNLLGYLKEFFKKMGFEKIRFIPSYYPYTEPSVQIDVFNKDKKQWFELGGAGIFRPEVVIPLLGENITVLAWGPGFDRMIMDYYEIKDLRELYKNNINQLRKTKFWMK
ncbi:phenylalanine--tRNA ligase subunit alpha [Candidatus Woesearchaeota archaeon]|jgi:phenylalanyl-tRNA synthetase alpha chain|nr:phenylalanine--tRNA ligase subunit alpha [Candidatus Woesearchaeota archaeon]